MSFVACAPEDHGKVTTMLRRMLSGRGIQGVLAATGASLLAAAITGPAVAGDPAVVVELEAARDTTIFQPGDLSNGAGPVIFAGRNGGGGGGIRQRALMAFDIGAAIPAGATITSVTLELTLEQASGGSGLQTVALRRALAEWGEGTSATMSGSGAPAQPGDATWTERIRPGILWAMPGGDADAAPSASLDVAPVPGPYVWTGAGLVDDVQAWLDGQVDNHGWLIQGGEASPGTSRRFASRETGAPATAPRLRVTYLAPACFGDIDESGTVGTSDLISLLAAWGTCKACPADLNADGSVDATDLISLLAAWGPCP